MWIWLLLLLVILTALAAGFVIIARKGRELRTNQPLPPPAKTAYIEWSDKGEKNRVEISPPFYIGKDPGSNIVLEASRARFEACIFHHKERFAFQSLQNPGIISINGEEKLAGYLRDGDEIFIAGTSFLFHCF